MKIHFISFANTTSNFSNERIIFEAKKMEVFNSLKFYTEEDFDEDFLKTNGSYFENYKRGYGYWSWKPYIIKKELEKINNGDVIVYADSGCSFIRKNRNELIRWIIITSKSKSGILSPCYGPYIEHDWTRGDLHDYIDKTYNKNHVDIFENALQCGAGILVICKNDKSVDFVNQWYDVMTNHFHLCTDEPSSIPNHPHFSENRHDQSVFSMLSKIYGIETIETFDGGIMDKSVTPIYASRIRGDKNTWKRSVFDIPTKKINIVTINLNNKDGLERTINSVINQTYFDKVNYIVIDGRSTDGSVDVIKNFNNNSIYWISEKDDGVYNAMNKGVGLCKGEYVLFLNSGDFFANNDVIEKAYNELDCDIVYGDIYVKTSSTVYLKKYASKLDDSYFKRESLPHPASFIKLEQLAKKKYNEGYSIISDWIFFYEGIVKEGLTYKHIDVPISVFSLGGVSSNVNNVNSEKNRYFNDLTYDCKVGVVIPCYNSEHYIEETINSLKKQTFTDWKCAIVNDGSTDRSENVILKCIKGDKRFIYIKQLNQGVPPRNIGIGNLNSKYIFCLDSDDIIDEKYFELGVEFLDKNPDYSIFYGNAKFLYGDGEIKDWKLPEYNPVRMLKSNMIYCSFLYRRSDYEKTDGYDETMKGFEDWDFLIRLTQKAGKIYRSDKTLFYYRRHQNSLDITYNRGENRIKMLEYIYKKNENIYKKHEITLNDLLKVYNKKPKKTVLFDNQIYDLQKFGGISRMYTDIRKRLNKEDEFNVDLSLKCSNNAYLKDEYPSGKCNNFVESVERLKKGDFDVFYPTYFYTYFLKDIGNKPFVMSVHDMIPEIYKEFFKRDDLQIVGKREMVKHAAAIEVPTECTKKDLIRILGVDEKKIHVVGRALNPEFGSKWYSRSVVNFDYILYVGQRGGYKRFDWFIKHITPFILNHPEINIICTGNKFTENELALLEKYGIKERCYTAFADDIALATLYKYAKFFVFSSEYEGFGLPVLESYKMGCVALLNNIEVFREITDNRGTFFNMTKDESNLSEVAEKVYSMTDEERDNVLKTQYEILNKFSFEKYINNIKRVFNAALLENNNIE